MLCADAVGRWLSLLVRELLAGAALRLAGYRPAQAWVRAGGTAGQFGMRNAQFGIEGVGAVLRGDSGSIAALWFCFMPAMQFY